MYIWDPNNPYDDYPDRYDNNIENRLIINGPTSWSYNSGDPSDPIVYSGGGWCLCVPLSDIMKKSRHPFAIDVAAEVLQTLFVGGPGAAVSQVTDDQGRRLYKNDNDTHTSWSEIETHPDKRLKGVVRWPWPGYKGKPPGELYFIRAPRGKIPNLKVTCSGKNYNVMFHSSGNLVEIKTISPGKTRDILRFSKIDSYEQSIEIKTSGNQREYDVKQLRTDITRKNYRSFHVKNLKIDPNLPVVPITIDIVGDFEAVEVSAKERKINFQVDILQNREGKVTTRQLKKLTTVPGKQLMIAPKNWMKLDTTELEKKTSIRLKKKKKQTNKKF
jgi:hypothetical protein